jgi:two-component system NtrC family sensor kinase
LLKDNTNKYISFYDSLQSLPRIEQGDPLREELRGNLFPAEPSVNAGNMLEKYFYMVQSIVSFEKQISLAQDVRAISNLIKMSLKRIIPIKEADLFFFNDTRTFLFPLDATEDDQFSTMVNNVYKEGILDWVFDNNKPTVIPEVNNFTSSGSKLNFIFFPVIEDKKKKGLLAVLTTLSKEDFSDFESQSIQIMLGVSLAKIDKIDLKEKLNKTYSELQTYQAKLSNDFRLSAIGELTEGIVEDIKSPLQVILSCADLMCRDESDQQTAGKVKEQVRRINYMVNRLVKFSSINEEKIKIHPCDINNILTEYYNLIKSSLENANIECVLDFEKNIPSVLSHPSYIYQLMSNIVSMVKSSSQDGGGIIIQTRSVSEDVVIKVINTVHIAPLHTENNSLNKSSDLNLKIIDNIMRMHEGIFKLDSFQKNSSVIMLRFPLRRRFR